MKVKILKADSVDYWYANRIGKIFSVSDYSATDWYTTDTADEMTVAGYILKTDASEPYYDIDDVGYADGYRAALEQAAKRITGMDARLLRDDVVATIRALTPKGGGDA